MKKHRGLKLFLVCFLVGLGIGWLIMRDRDRDREQAARTPAADVASADLADDFYADADEVDSDTLAVDFADDVDPAYVAEVGKKLGLSFRPASSYVDHDRIYVAAAGDDLDEDLAALRADPRVEAAEEEIFYSVPDNELAATQTPVAPARGPFPNDPRYAEQWHLRQIHMEETWPVAQGEGVIVAVIDTGVTKVADLAGTEFVPGWNFVDNTAKTDDDHGHGTHVAGTIAQSTNNGIGVAGVAYKAKIMPMKVLSARGSGSVTGIAEAIRWAADHGAKVMNMSLGGAMSSKILAQAVKYAHDKGVTVVCAAGNDGKGKVSYPAAYPGAIAVAATQKDEATTFYSNWGKQIDIAAPGGNTRGDASGGVLQNTVFMGKEDYYFFMGTSMASPHVAGVAALVVGQGVTDPDAVEKVLKETARKPATKAGDSDYALRYGAGIVDAQAAVKKAKVASGAIQLLAGGGLAALLVLGLRRKNLLAGFGVGGVVATVVGASGLFFLPYLGVGGFPGAQLVTQGLPAWDSAIFGAAGHGNLLFYSALLPMLAGILLFGRSRLRGILAGLAFGVAGHLFAQAWLGSVDIRWMPWDNAWLIGNGLFATVIGYVAARK